MPKISIELDLPEDVAEKALKYGKLTPEAVREMIARAVSDYPDEEPPVFDPALAGYASPKLLGSVKIIGDLDEPEVFDPRLAGYASPKLLGSGIIIGDLDEPPSVFDPMLTGYASPKLVGSVKIVGDLDEPSDVKWEACGDGD